MTRDDLLHLSPEALTQAANAGIVKRAVRELDGGYRPELQVADDGTLSAAFSDGVRVTWPPATPIQHARCTCGAATVCRHRIIAALAYRESATADAPAAVLGSPGEASDEALARVIPAALLARASASRDAGLSIDVRRRASGEPCDTARLPAATVRFWAGPAVEAARCDCVAAAACEHVALGVWAFRAADAQDPAAPGLQVRLGQPGRRATLDEAPWQALAEALMRHGVASGPTAIAPALSVALDTARKLQAVWLQHLLADLEAWAAAYAARSALYDASEGVALLAELALRLRGGVLPGHAQAVLGIGEGGETELDRLRLTCLGARVTRDGEARHARLVLADTDTGTALVLRHAWKVAGHDAAAEETARASQKLAPGVRLDALAKGQLLARQAKRRADGSVSLARSRAAQNSVLPQVPDWAALGAPLRYDTVAALRAQQRAHPTAALLPRHAARRFVVFTPNTLEPMAYDATSQTVAAVLRDGLDEPVLVRRTHEAHARQALDALAEAFSGARGPVRHVAGVLHWAGGLAVLDPWGVACDTIVVPDVAAGTPGTALASLPLARVPEEAQHPIGAALARLRSVLAELLHHGLAQLPAGWKQDAAETARLLAALSLHALAQRAGTLSAAVMTAQANPRDARLAPLLLDLLALAQLHADALVTSGLGQSEIRDAT